MDPGLFAPRMVYDAQCMETSSGSDALFRIRAGSCSFEVDSTMCPFPTNVFAGVACRKLTELPSNCQSLVALQVLQLVSWDLSACSPGLKNQAEYVVQLRSLSTPDGEGYVCQPLLRQFQLSAKVLDIIEQMQ